MTPIEVRCPYCGHDNEILAPGKQECELCCATFDCDVRGQVLIVSACPNCGKEQAFDDEHRGNESQEQDDVGGFYSAWFVRCRHCDWGFEMKGNGQVVNDFLVETDCPHCQAHFNLQEPAQEPFEVRCLKCDGTFDIDKNGDRLIAIACPHCAQPVKVVEQHSGVQVCSSCKWRIALCPNGATVVGEP